MLHDNAGLGSAGPPARFRNGRRPLRQRPFADSSERPADSMGETLDTAARDAVRQGGRGARRLCVALIMMDCTERDARVFLGGFGPGIVLYIEMVTAALVFGAGSVCSAIPLWSTRWPARRSDARSRGEVGQKLCRGGSILFVV